MIPEIIGVIMLLGGGTAAWFRNKENVENVENVENIELMEKIEKNKERINPEIHPELNYFICLKCKKKIDIEDVIFWHKWPFCSGFCIELYIAEK